MQKSSDYAVPGTQASGSRWQPNRDTWVALGSYVAVVAGLALAFQVFTTERVAANFITFAPRLAATAV